MYSSDEGQTPPSASSSFKIPEPKDGFFGYNEKMNLKQIHAKVLTNRRGSDADIDTWNLNPISIANSVVEDERQHDQLLGDAHVSGKFFYDYYLGCRSLPLFRTNYQR